MTKNYSAVANHDARLLHKKVQAILETPYVKELDNLTGQENFCAEKQEPHY